MTVSEPAAAPPAGQRAGTPVSAAAPAGAGPEPEPGAGAAAGPRRRTRQVIPADIADPALADAGTARINWAERASQVLRQVRERFESQRPLEGLTVAACLHVTAETAVLVRTLRAGGARVFLAASNPLSTQDDTAAALATRYGIAVFARAGVDRPTYYRHIHQVLDFPVVAANDTATMRLFDNTHGTGQSVIDGILRATNTLLAGKTVVVAGYGACGRGVADRARGLGAQVIVTEIDPVRALDAVLAGLRVLPMAAAAPLGEVFITATGSRDVISAGHLAAMRDGAILANAGHFDVEIDLRALYGLAAEVNAGVRQHTDEYVLADGRRLLLLAEGRVVNLVAAEGHPAAVMDLSFGCQALVLGWLAANAAGLPPGVHDVPGAIDAEVARLELAAMRTEIDEPTQDQQEYLNSWHHGS